MQYLRGMVWAVLAVGLVPMAAQAQLNEKWGVPGSPTGQAVAVVLEMVDRGDEAYIRQMVEERFAPEFASMVPMAEHVRVFLDLHEQLPGLEPAGLMRSPEGARLRIVGSNGASATLELGVDERGMIVGIQLSEGGADGPSSGASLPERLEAWEAAGEFSGVVYRWRDGGPLWARAYGQANRSDGVENTVDTRFNIASLTKAFTGAAILMLWEEGRLDLDDPIGRYLDGFPEEVAASVTIRHLLMHRSGWGHYWENEAFRSRLADLREISDYMAFIRDIPLDFEPGTDRQYSNVGYEVLGAVVESVTGGSYHAFVQERIFDELGMDASGFFHRDQPTPRRAIGYTDSHPHAGGDSVVMANTFLLAPVGTAAGGSYSTAEDLVRFWAAVRDYELLGETASHMIMGDYREGQGAPGGVNVYAGGGPGIRAMVVLNPDTGGLDVVLSNTDSPVTSQIAQQLEEGS